MQLYTCVTSWSTNAVYKAIADPTRRAIPDQLADKDKAELDDTAATPSRSRPAAGFVDAGRIRRRAPPPARPRGARSLLLSSPRRADPARGGVAAAAAPHARHPGHDAHAVSDSLQ